jgi:Uma2 family endonuclease
MATISESQTTVWTASEVLARFGDIPIVRIRTTPPPGEATEADVIDLHEHHDRLCELIDGTLVEKTMGWKESTLAGVILTLLNSFVLPRKLGFVFSTDGMLRLAPEQIRIPDVAFVSKERFAGRQLPTGAFWDLGCDLAVEVISPSNTRREMERKLVEYFAAGVRAVWLVYPKTREVAVHSSPTDSVTRQGDELLDGGAVLPGFTTPVAEIFKVLDEGPVNN